MAGKLTCVNIEVSKPLGEDGGAILCSDVEWKTEGVTNAQYRKFPDGTVELRVKHTTTGTLPAGYIPNASIFMPFVNFLDWSQGLVQVNDAGVITLLNCTATTGDWSVYRFYAGA